TGTAERRGASPAPLQTGARGLRALLHVIALALLLQLQVAGPVQVSGQVLRVVEGDSVPAASARVTLHRVGEAVQGAVDSTITGADGRFSFRARIDSGDVLLASARWHGVEYFAEPVVSGVPVRVMVAD